MKGAGFHSIPKEPKTRQSIVLALFVHLVLLAFLWIGISWKSQEGGHIDAEVWDIKVSEAAPQAPAPEPVAEVKPDVPEPKEEPAEIKPDAKPDIALKDDQKKKEEKKKEEKRKEEEKKKAKEAEAEKKKQQLKLADQKKADAIMAEEAKRLSAKSGTGGKGTSAYSTGGRRADAGYSQKVGAKIKSNTAFNVPENLSGNPPVEYDVELLPDGSIKGIKKRKSSGIPGFDEAVLRAIEKSAPYPQDDKSGRVPSLFNISHKPKG